MEGQMERQENKWMDRICMLSKLGFLCSHLQIHSPFSVLHCAHEAELC